MAVLLIAATPIATQEKTAQPDAQHVIYSKEPFDLRIVSHEGQYAFFGLVQSCGAPFFPSALVVFDPVDSVKYTAVPIHRTLQMYGDSCQYEKYAFGVHAGQLRHIVERPGLLQIVVIGAENAAVFTLTEAGESELLKFLPAPKKDKASR